MFFYPNSEQGLLGKHKNKEYCKRLREEGYWGQEPKDRDASNHHLKTSRDWETGTGACDNISHPSKTANLFEGTRCYCLNFKTKLVRLQIVNCQ